MPNPIKTRQVAPMSADKAIPQTKVDDPVYWSPPTGLDLTSRLSRVKNESCVDIENLMLDDGSLRSRYGTDLFGGVTSQDLMAVIGFVSPSGKGYIARVTTREIQRWDGVNWVTMTDPLNPPFHGGLKDYFSFTSFGNQLIIANGVDKLYYIDFSTGKQGVIDESSPARHITSFNGRIVASHVVDGATKPYRIRWSVKNDSMDWIKRDAADLTGDGAGFEDLFATPGGTVDTAHGVYPISDDTALIVRENSVWQMSVTGNVLAPHRFTRVFAELGTRCRRSVAMIPGGIVYVTRDNVVAISTTDIKRIGEPVKHAIIDSIVDYDAVVGKYDPKRLEYRLAIGDTVWRFSFRDHGWTKDIYPFQIRDMTTMEIFRLGLPIDSLPTLGAKIDDLPGVIDDLLGSGGADGFFFVGY